MYEEIKNQIIETAREMKNYRLISLCGGNVAVRLKDNTVLVTPSAMSYETMKPEDIVRVDMNGKKIEGIRKPSSDLNALIYIFKHLDYVNAIIHTHQPYATAIGLVEDYFPPVCITQVGIAFGGVNIAPFTISSDIGMGELAVEYLGNSSAVILKNHGVIAVGNDLENCLYSAVYLEEAAQTYTIARSMSNNISIMNDEQIKSEIGDYKSFADYLNHKDVR